MSDEETEEQWFRRMDRDANAAVVIVSLFMLALIGGVIFILRM